MSKTKQIVVSSLLIALGTILSMLKLFELPFGGTVTVASMAPIVLIGFLFGTRFGLVCAFASSLLQLVLGIGTGIVSTMFLPGEGQMALWKAISICLLDYILAYTVLGFGGIFKGKLKNNGSEIVLGAVFATFLRFVMHVISGYIFYGAWAGWFFGEADGLMAIPFLEGFCAWVMDTLSGNALALFYSVIYNAAYMLPEMIITAIVSPIIYYTIKKSKLV